MKIIIAGYGPVGQAMHHALDLRRDVEVFIDDPKLGYTYTPNTYNNSRESGITPPDGVIVCVATPPTEDGDGRCNTQHVEDVLEKYYGARVLIKSTVDPLWLSYNTETNVTFSPEFLRGTIGSDPTQEFMDSEFAIYGGGDMRWWYELFKPVLPKCNNVKFCSLEQAAFAKYVENCFLATKVTFFNQMREIYDAMQFNDFDVMVDAISVDPRIGFSHTQVPGPDGQLGYGGHCLPKDMSAMICAALDVDADPSFLINVQQANKRYRNE